MALLDGARLSNDAVLCFRLLCLIANVCGRTFTMVQWGLASSLFPPPLSPQVAPEFEVSVTIINEAGASVYSVSPEAELELPDRSPAERGAISLARRLQDPLAELLKIDPQRLGVGMYGIAVPTHTPTHFDLFVNAATLIVVLRPRIYERSESSHHYSLEFALYIYPMHADGRNVLIPPLIKCLRQVPA